MTESEIALVLAWQAREEDAVRALFERYYPKAVRLASASGLADEEAKDCAQEAFISAYASRGQLRQPAAFPQWFYRIFTHRLAEALRRRPQGQIPLEAVDDADVNLRHALPSPDDLAISAEEGREIRRRVLALPPHYRIPLILRYYGDLSFQEIAQITGKREGTVRVTIHRALCRLRLDDQNDTAQIEATPHVKQLRISMLYGE